MHARIFGAAVVAALLLAAPAHANDDERLKIIAHPSTPLAEIAEADLAKIFLGQVTRWTDGRIARPIDLGSLHPGRRIFSETVLHRQVNSVKRYWYQQVFSGRGMPPPEKASTAEVVAYVAATPGAVGYVAANTDTSGCKVLVLTEE